MVVENTQVESSAFHSNSNMRLGVSEILKKIEIEILDLSETSDDIQIIISEALSRGIDKDHIRRISSLQELDRISQTLRALSRLTSALSKLDLTGGLEEAELRMAIGLESISSRFFPDIAKSPDGDDIWL